MTPTPDNVILCEGYHDRAFLSGWLAHLGCKTLKDKPYRDGKPLRGGGQFGYRTPNEGWARILPVDGDGKLYPRAKILSRRPSPKKSPTWFLSLIAIPCPATRAHGRRRSRASSGQ